MPKFKEKHVQFYDVVTVKDFPNRLWLIVGWDKAKKHAPYTGQCMTTHERIEFTLHDVVGVWNQKR